MNDMLTPTPTKNPNPWRKDVRGQLLRRAASHLGLSSYLWGTTFRVHHFPLASGRPWFAFDRKEISRKIHPPLMVAMANELLQMLGFAHPLGYGHVTAMLEDLRPALESTTFFRESPKNVKLFHARALGNTNVLATQKLATIALNHVFAMLGLRLKSTSKGRQEVKGGDETGRKRRRLYMYGAWYLERSPGSEALPVVRYLRERTSSVNF